MRSSRGKGTNQRFQVLHSVHSVCMYIHMHQPPRRSAVPDEINGLAQYISIRSLLGGSTVQQRYQDADDAFQVLEDDMAKASVINRKYGCVTSRRRYI